MKLSTQLNLAFGALIAIVIGVTAIINHYVLLDHFVGAQKEGMTAVGARLSAQLNQGEEALSVLNGEALRTASNPGLTAESSLTASFAPVPLESVRLQPVAGTAAAVEMAAVITDTDGRLVYAPKLTETTSGAPATAAKDNVSFRRTESLDAENLENKAKLMEVKQIVTGQDSRYVIAKATVPQGTLTLYSEMSKIKAIEHALLTRLLVVLGIAGVLVYVLSLILTRKLIRPLMKLKGELKKVEQRQFSEVKLVRAGGEIGAVAETVYELAGELDRHTRAQKHFFQNASHELKTPLMSISGYAEGIRDGVFEGESARKGLDVIMSESGRLKNLVTEMTLLAKLDSEEDVFVMETADLEGMVSETKERINPLLANKSLELDIRIDNPSGRPLTVTADETKLSQALLNVVSNATRYAESRIEVVVATVKNQVVITVSDDGKGFPQEVLPTVFHRFVKGKDGETGLGLAIARAIVERCRGKISASNRSGGGASVELVFPAMRRMEVAEKLAG